MRPMRKFISGKDNLFQWTGAISLENRTSGVSAWRIPRDQDVLYSEALIKWAKMPAGVTINFSSDTSFLQVHGKHSLDTLPGADIGVWDLWDVHQLTADLFCDGKLVDSKPVVDKDSIKFGDLGDSSKEFQLWLPHMGEYIFHGITIDSSAEIKRPSKPEKPKWMSYGDSITQGVGASKPSETWTATTALVHGYELLSLGYGGNCHLDSMVARLIRDQDADFISLSIGANIQIQSSLNIRTFLPSVIGFIQIIREKHVATPLLVTSPMYCEEAGGKANKVGLTMEAVREEVERAVKVLTDYGDPDLPYLDGTELLGPQHSHLFPDHKHPNSEGYAVIAENIASAIPLMLK